MKWITLIGDEKLTLESIKAIQYYGSIRSHDVWEGRYCVVYSDTDHIFYDYFDDDNWTSQYNDAEREKIPFASPHFIMMVYKSGERVKEIIQQDNFLRGIYVDNDSDVIAPIEEFIEMGMPMEP
ncbi:MAG: hypothetical protein FWG40_09790 [Peptococcaceae bacterium]|nr:hypothetical protein [Peptococcaceae bacterium]